MSSGPTEVLKEVNFSDPTLNDTRTKSQLNCNFVRTFFGSEGTSLDDLLTVFPDLFLNI